MSLFAMAFAVGVVAGMLPLLIFIAVCVLIGVTFGAEGAFFGYIAVFLLPVCIPGYVVGMLAKWGFKRRRAKP